MPDQVTVSIFAIIGSALTGGLSGAVVNSIITRRRQKLEITLKLVDYFLSMYSEIADVHILFQNKSPLSEIKDRNKVRKVGDWFEWVLILIQNKSVDVDLLKRAGMLHQIDGFQNYVKSFKVSSEVLNSAWASWTNLQSFHLASY